MKAQRSAIKTGMSSTVFRTEIKSRIVAVKVVDTDFGEAPPHSVRCEIAILEYLNQRRLKSPKGHQTSVTAPKISNATVESESKSSSIPEFTGSSVVELLEWRVVHDNYELIFPFYKYTLSDFLKKHSRLKTRPLDSTESSLIDPIDWYFEVDEASSKTQRINKMEMGMAKSIVTKLLEGVSFLHDNGVIHRDIKPDNIMFSDENGDPVIIDFGISYASCASRADESDAKKHTQISTGVFKPPEVLLGITDYSYEVDIWSLGLVFSQIFSRKCVPVLDKSGNFSDLALLHSIFKIFGTPTRESMRKFDEIPYFKSFSFTVFDRMKVEQVLDYGEGEFFEVFKGVFEKMMVYDGRVEAKEALRLVKSA